MAKSNDIGSLVTNLQLNDAKFHKDMKRATVGVRSFSAKTNKFLARAERGWKSFSRSVGSITKKLHPLKMALGAVAGVGAMGYLIKSSMNTADAIGKAADRIGISTDALQEYRHAAGLAGIDLSVLESGLEAFTKRIGEARQGTGAMATYLAKYNEGLLDSIVNAGSTSDALSLLFTEMSNMSSASDKAALSAAAFSRSAGLKMTLLVKGGIAGLTGTLKEARDYGLIVSEKVIRDSELANDKMATVLAAVKAKFVEMAASFAPAVTEISERFLNWIKENKEAIESKLKDLQKYVVDSVNGIVGAFKLMSGGELIPKLDASNLETFSITAANTAISVLGLAQSFLRLSNAMSVFDSPTKKGRARIGAVVNEQTAKYLKSIGKRAEASGDTEKAREFYKRASAAGQVAVDFRNQLVSLAEPIDAANRKIAEYQTKIDALSQHIVQAHEKTAVAGTKAKEHIEEVIRVINGTPVTMYINVSDALKSVDKVDKAFDRLKKKISTINSNVKMTGEASSRKPLTEKINDVLDLYKLFPEQMKLGIDMTSLSGAYAALEKIPAKLKLYETVRSTAISAEESLARGVKRQGSAIHWGNLRARSTSYRRKRESAEVDIEAYTTMRQGLLSMIESGYYNRGGSPGLQDGGGTQPARLNIGPVTVTVSGTGGDRDLAISLADELDHEIANKIIHNRSEITAALGITNVSN